MQENIIEEKKPDFNFKKPTVLQVSIFFIVEIVFFVFVSYFIGYIYPKDWSIMLRIAITHFIAILVPPLVFLKLFKFNFKKVLRLNKVSVPIFFNVVFLMGAAIFFTAMVNFIYMLVYTRVFGEIEIPDIPTMTGINGFFINILIIAIFPAVFEEILFRGTIQRGFERIGSIKGVIITGILFGVMHFNVYQLVGLIMLGCFIGYIVYRTDSLYMGMLAHFLNNALTIVFQTLVKFMQKFYEQPAQSENVNQVFESIDIEVIIAICIMILSSGAVLAGLILLLHYLTKNIGENKKIEEST